MGKLLYELTDELIEFIGYQKIFFVGTATADSRISLSPKGMDSFRVLNKKRVVWMNMTGSGNETSAHVQDDGRMTIMFCSFDEKPLILRLYGKAEVIHHSDRDWQNLVGLFPDFSGARQIFDLSIESLQTSCGFGVPRFEYVEERKTLVEWTEKRSVNEIHEYWKKNNTVSIDGIPTNIIAKNLNE